MEDYTTETESGYRQIDSSKLIEIGRANRDKFNFATRSEQQSVGLKTGIFKPSL